MSVRRLRFAVTKLFELSQITVFYVQSFKRRIIIIDLKFLLKRPYVSDFLKMFKNVNLMRGKWPSMKYRQLGITYQQITCMYLYNLRVLRTLIDLKP